MREFGFINPNIVTTIGIFLIILLFVFFLLVRKIIELREDLTDLKISFSKEILRIEKYEMEKPVQKEFLFENDKKVNNEVL